MNFLMILYVLFVLAGIVWVVLRFMRFSQSTGESDSKLAEMAADPELKGMLTQAKDAKRREPARSAVQQATGSKGVQYKGGFPRRDLPIGPGRMNQDGIMGPGG